MNNLLKMLFLFFWPVCLLASGDPQFLLFNQITKHTKWVQETHGLQVTYQAVSMPDGPIQDASLGLHMKAKLNIDEARKIFIACTQDLLTRLNTDKKLRSWLFNYPFTAKDICYSISFDGLKRGLVLKPNIAVVRMAKGTITYQIWDPEREDEIEVYREPYAHALKEVSGGSTQ